MTGHSFSVSGSLGVLQDGQSIKKKKKRKTERNTARGSIAALCMGCFCSDGPCVCLGVGGVQISSEGDLFFASS